MALNTIPLKIVPFKIVSVFLWFSKLELRRNPCPLTCASLRVSPTAPTEKCGQKIMAKIMA
jgi:hypothetical protein